MCYFIGRVRLQISRSRFLQISHTSHTVFARDAFGAKAFGPGLVEFRCNKLVESVVHVNPVRPGTELVGMA